MSAHASHAVTGDPSARAILLPGQLDRLGEAMLALTSEVWILTDRLTVLEAVLDEQGINVSAAIATDVPNPTMEKALDAKRDKLIGIVLGALNGAGSPAS
jgi:hypothetical protein